MIKVLVIEDEFDIRDEVMSWLEFEGYEVYGAENGKQGLEAVYRHEPDMVLCDISMPEMDGHQVLIEVRSDMNFAQLPFVFMTAAIGRDAMRIGMNLGADDYLTKPFTQAEIINVVKTRLGKQQQVQEQIDQLSGIINVEREQRLLKSRLVGMFSHDFRNPLASILSSSNLLQTYADRLTPEQRTKKFAHIDGAVHRLLQMLDEMLMVAEIENGQLAHNPQTVDFKKMMEKLIADFLLIDSEKHTINLSITMPDTVLIDPKLVQHIITNLISNALKYSPDRTEVSINACFENNCITVSVQDAGIGIPKQDLARVFEPFFRSENAQIAKGTGLGLALVKEAVDVCGGTITVSSEVNKGTLFTVNIPARAR